MPPHALADETGFISTMASEPLRHLFNSPSFLQFITDNSIRDASGCLLWRLSTTDGYGYFKHNLRGYKTHRVVGWSYSNVVFDLRDISLDVCHTCDVRRCNEPTHLVIATRRYNVRDAIAKGRFKFNYYPRQLTAEQVIEIRELSRQGVINFHLSKRFGVDSHAIKQIVEYKTYKDIP